MTQSPFFTSDRHLSETGLALYADALQLHQLDTVPKDIIQHLEQCQECKHHIIGISDLMNSEPYRQTVLDQPQTRWISLIERYPSAYRFAAVFMLAAFAGTLYFVMPVKRSVQPDSTAEKSNTLPAPEQQKEKIQEQAPSDYIAANFEPSANLDDLTVAEFRSSAIEVISPATGDVVTTPITFRWKETDSPVTIRILTNKEKTLATSVVEDNTFVLSKSLAPGLYYWKLESNEELLFVGKFFIR